MQSFVKDSLPNTSFICNLCTNYKTWYFWYNSDAFYSKYVFFMKKQKYKTQQKCCSCRQTCNCVFVLGSNSSSQGNTFYHINEHSSLKGGMYAAVTHDSPWNRLTERLALINLLPHDVCGSGDCFFKAVSHQLYSTAELHFEVRMAGIGHLNNHPELYIESIANDKWRNYVKQMSQQGTWCDNIIIQATANAFNCVIHITESNIRSPEGTIITPVAQEGRRKTVFLGYINEVHYVSTLTNRNSQNSNSLKSLKRKLSETNDNKQERLAKKRDHQKRQRSAETENERQSRLAKKKRHP